MFRRKTALFFILVFVLASFLSFAARAATVRDVVIEPDAPGRAINFSLVMDSHVAYRAFLLDNPKRVVIDFPVLNWKASGGKRDSSGVIKSYRQARFQSDTTRVVLDINEPVTIAKTETLGQKDRSYKYVIHLQPVNQRQFKQSVNQIVRSQEPVTEPEPVVTKTTTTVTNTVIYEDDKNSSSPKKLIVIDAGHGGVDPGAIATNGVYEKNITLGVARELRNMLEASGRYKVKMTRDSDVFVILQDRVKIARRAKGDLFVSLHADTISRPAVQGASVYTLSDQASDAEAARLAERENQVDALVGGVNLGTQDKDVADILLDLVVRDNMNQSKILADTVVTGLRRGGVQTLQGSHRFAGFAVLKAPDIPSILIEMGYLSNAQEAERLNTVEHRQRIARAVMSSIDRYFNETSKKTEF